MNIALTLSGGGYRAAAFHLGTLSMLHHVKTETGTLLEHVEVLSTVSGGTLTGLRYMQALTKGEDIDEMTRSIYKFFFDVDMMTMALQQLDDKNPQEGASAIRTMVDIFDEKLFGHATFADFIDKMGDLPVKHYSANATDFESGIPFRFQASEKIGNYQGFFGNVDHRLSLATASKVTLGEAMACSSCFPGGFEPLVFPDDFALANTEDGKKMKEKYGSFGIMDGGCVDNQGIEAILLVEERMRKKEKARKDKAIDLVLISDVTSPYMKGYKPFTGSLPRFIRKLTLKRIGNWLWLFSGLFAVALIVALLYHLFLPSVISGVLFAVVGTLTVLFHWGKKELTKVLNGTFVKHAVPDLMNLSLGNIATMVANRATSLVILITSVFMKHIRRKEYASIYVDPGWANRSITNAIYELRPDELWESRLKNKSLPSWLQPSAQMQQVSAKATGMALSLWFTEKDKADNMPKTIIAAGQFTTCFNLLDYLDKLKASSWNVSERIEELKACETQLREMWEKFRENPYWLVDSVID